MDADFGVHRLPERTNASLPLPFRRIQRVEIAELGGRMSVALGVDKGHDRYSRYKRTRFGRNTLFL